MKAAPQIQIGASAAFRSRIAPIACISSGLAYRRLFCSLKRSTFGQGLEPASRYPQRSASFIMRPRTAKARLAS